MPVYEADAIHKILREQKGYLLDCLAEDILTRFNTKEERKDFLNRMHKRRLGPKELYKQQIKRGRLSDKGGDGLGFIDMVRKTGEQLIYSLIKINNKISYFILKSTIYRIK